MTEGFGLGTIKEWYLHNSGNDAVLTLVVALLAGLNDGLHGPAKGLRGFPPNDIQGRTTQDILRAATVKIKTSSFSGWANTVFCHRCGVVDHLASACTKVEVCAECGFFHPDELQCLNEIRRDPRTWDFCRSRQHAPEKCFAARRRGYLG